MSALTADFNFLDDKWKLLDWCEVPKQSNGVGCHFYHLKQMLNEGIARCLLTPLYGNNVIRDVNREVSVYTQRPNLIEIL
jgi:hypothetical protein